MYEENSKVYLINHFKALLNACSLCPVELSLNFNNFQMYAKFNNKTFVFYPQFLTITNDEPKYTHIFNHDVVCFNGWRPYSYENLSQIFSDKLHFKKALSKLGFLTPAYSLDNNNLLNNAIIKRREGSFGKNLRGPFRTAADYHLDLNVGEFCEKFINGRIVKISYWTNEPLYVEFQNMPRFTGDGVNTIEMFAEQRASQRGRKKINYTQLNDLLRYQNKTLASILSPNESILADFRYESDFSECYSVKELPLPDRALINLVDKLETLGEFLYYLIRKEEHIEHLFFTVDAILDKNQKLWFLEFNSNPTVHQSTYPIMLKSLWQSI